MSSDARSRLATGWLTMFVIGSDLFVVSPLLPQIAASFAVAAATAGLCVTVFALVYMAGAPLLGHIGDRVGRRRILVFCLGVFAIANLLTAVAGSFAWLLGARLLAGAAAAGVSPSVYALAGGSAPFGRRGTHLAIVVSGLLASLTLAAPCAALIGPKIGWPAVFAGIAALGILLAWANLRVWPAPGGAAGTEAPPGRLAIGALAPRLAPTVVWSTALYGTYTYLGTGLGLAGYATGPIAGIILLYGCGAMVGVLLGGRITDRFGERLATTTALAGLSGCFLLLQLALHAGVLVGCAFWLLSAVAQVFFPAQQAGLARDFPGWRTTVLAWNNSALFLGISLGSLIGGRAVAVGGFAADLAVSAVIAIIGCAINAFVVASPAYSAKEAADRQA
jgi:MFS transporter, DHA1 family, putative efflux transporter